MADDACGVAVILGAVCRVELVVEVGVGVHEGDVFVNAASLNVAFYLLMTDDAMRHIRLFRGEFHG